MQSRWTDPDTDPIRPPSPVAAAVALLCIFALFLVGIVAWASDAGAASIRCGGPCPTVPDTTIATTTTEPQGDPGDTTTTTSTVPTTTTTVGATTTAPNVGICCLQAATTTTTAPASTTTTVTATSSPPTTATTLPPATTVSAPVAGAVVGVGVGVSEPVDTLPVTGGSPWWLALFGVCLIALGGLGMGVDADVIHFALGVAFGGLWASVFWMHMIDKTKDRLEERMEQHVMEKGGWT